MRRVIQTSLRWRDAIALNWGWDPAWLAAQRALVDLAAAQCAPGVCDCLVVERSI